MERLHAAEPGCVGEVEVQQDHIGPLDGNQIEGPFERGRATDLEGVPRQFFEEDAEEHGVIRIVLDQEDVQGNKLLEDRIVLHGSLFALMRRVPSHHYRRLGPFL